MIIIVITVVKLMQHAVFKQSSIILKHIFYLHKLINCCLDDSNSYYNEIHVTKNGSDEFHEAIDPTAYV